MMGLLLEGQACGDPRGGGAAPIDACRRMVDAFPEAGDAIDTASNYRGDAGERIVDELLVGRRERFVARRDRSPTEASAEGSPCGR
jgi:aryl-alcohol dehydrogenase-like predicted oxidoreductase